MLHTPEMSKVTFASFPECCQKLLRLLAKEGRGGARNCEKGHAVSLEYARAVETSAAAIPNAPAGTNPTS